MGIDRDRTMEAVQITSRRSFFGLSLGGFLAALGLSRPKSATGPVEWIVPGPESRYIPGFGFLHPGDRVTVGRS